ncbi:type IV secretion system DNA-binding domain-containing protein [Hyphomonas sp. NPDC076900]|uniref:type IV secretion system DNA-binding domain-containing protein n=1 Tax=unclassified Hyphomonas TaxID=2630699 RepID=UPI003CFF856A
MSAAKFALAGTALLAMGTAYGTYHLNFERRTPVLRDATGYPVTRMPVADSTGCFAAKLASKTDKDARHAWASCERHLTTHGALDEFNRNFGISVGSGVAAAGGLAGLGMLAAFSGRRPRHLRGPKMLTGLSNYQRLARTLFKEAKQSGLGLNFPPGFFLSRDRESRHLMITGGVGSGKTQTLWHLILEAYYRGDQVLILDTKGDMTAGMPGDTRKPTPTHHRNHAP